MPELQEASSRRFAALALAFLIAVSAVICAFKGGGLHLRTGDPDSYLTAAFHLLHHHTLSEVQTSAAVPPQLGREPGYPLFLAALMAADPDFGAFMPECLDLAHPCGDAVYRAAGLANVAFILLAGIAMFAVAWRLCRSHWAALAAAAYMLLNVQMNKGWQDPMSDRLAVLLVCLAMLSAAWAWEGRGPWRWTGVGLALAALTLTKAAFFYYTLPMAALIAGAALIRRADRARILAALAAAMAIYGAVAGGWALRNRQISGMVGLTDTRGGFVLSERRAFDAMTPEQYLAAFVYWTRGFGPGLARRLFPAAVVDPFDEWRPDGFYESGHNGYRDRLAAATADAKGSRWVAAARLEGDEIRATAAHPLIHLATTLPLLYHGIWIDEFIVIGLPLFIWMGWRSWRERRWLALLLLSQGAFNLLFYASFSFDLPRYQMTAVPAFALAAGMAAALLARSRQLAAPELASRSPAP